MAVRRLSTKIIKPLQLQISSTTATASKRTYVAAVPPKRISFPLPVAVRRRHYSAQQSPKSASATTKACPSCGKILPLPTISCTNCNSLTPLPENINYLDLFNLPSTLPFDFDLNLATLRKEYLTIMSKVHPDSMSGKPDVFYLSK